MSHLHVDLLFLLLLMAGSRANTIDYTERCNLPRSVLLPEEHKNPRFPLQFIEFSCSSEKGRYGKCSKLGGIGNFLVLFPAVYLYAMVSGRHLILHDNSAMGQWCRALNCTFPFTSEVENLYPALKKIKKVPSYNPNDIAYNIRLNNSFPDTIVGLHSMEIFSSGWIDYAGKHTPECVERITGCHSKLVGCVERFAFQQLLHGGFRHGAIPSAVVGMLPSEVHQVLTAPYLSIPRFDAGIFGQRESDLELDSLTEMSPVEIFLFNDSVKTRIREFEDWLDGRSEERIVAVGHSRYFKVMLNADEVMDNCSIIKCSYHPRASSPGKKEEGDSSGSAVSSCRWVVDEVLYTLQAPDAREDTISEQHQADTFSPTLPMTSTVAVDSSETAASIRMASSCVDDNDSHNNINEYTEGKGDTQRGVESGIASATS